MSDQELNDITNRDVLELIREQYDNIFSAEKKVADFVLMYPQRTVNSSVSELAKCSEVSDATVVRMCRHIGYAGYYQFRIALARDLGRQQGEMPQENIRKNPVRQVFEEYGKTLGEIGKQIDEKTLWKCVDILKNADTIHVIAAGNTCNLSRYMGFRLERMGIRSTHESMPEYYINHINLAREGDVVLAISKSGSSKTVIKGLELAKTRRLKTISITSSLQSPITELSDYVLESSGTNQLFTINSSYAYMNEFAVVEVLLNFIANEDKIKKFDVVTPEVVLAESKM